jgi:hypothetical protein
VPAGSFGPAATRVRSMSCVIMLAWSLACPIVVRGTRRAPQIRVRGREAGPKVQHPKTLAVIVDYIQADQSRNFGLGVRAPDSYATDIQASPLNPAVRGDLP